MRRAGAALILAALTLAACADGPVPEPGEATVGPAPISPGAAPGNVPGPVGPADIDSSTDPTNEEIDPAMPAPGVTF